MRTLAIDLGAKRIGIALSDAGGKLATPLEVIAVSSAELAIDPILAIVKREVVERIVIGLPLNMDGSMSAQAQQVITWTNAFKAKLLSPLPVPGERAKGEGSARTRASEEIDVLFVDERLSSFDAEQQLNTRKRDGEKLTRKRRKQQLDAVAAAGFLQEYLDGKLAAIDIGSSES